MIDDSEEGLVWQKQRQLEDLRERTRAYLGQPSKGRWVNRSPKTKGPNTKRKEKKT